MYRHHGTPSPLVMQDPCNWLFFFILSPCCSLHVGLLLIGSPVWLTILLLNVALSITSLALNPVGLLLQESLNCMFPSYFRSSPLPFCLVPLLFLWYIRPKNFPRCVFFITPHHMPLPVRCSLSDLIEACATLFVPHKCSFRILRVNPYIHLSIIISFTLIPLSCLFVVANVSAT